MNYTFYMDNNNIYLGNASTKKMYKEKFITESFPNIPILNYLNTEYITNLLSKEEISKIKKIKRFFGGSIIIVYDADFTSDEKKALLEKFIMGGFKFAYLIEKSKVFSSNHNSYISMYSNERNTIIAKIIDGKIKSKKIISNQFKDQINSEIENIKNSHLALNIIGDNSNYCDLVISAKEINQILSEKILDKSFIKNMKIQTD